MRPMMVNHNNFIYIAYHVIKWMCIILCLEPVAEAYDDR